MKVDAARNYAEIGKYENVSLKKHLERLRRNGKVWTEYGL